MIQLAGITLLLAPATIALAAFVPAVLLWIYEYLPRGATWAFTVAAACICLAVPLWVASLASLTATPVGLRGLIAVSIVLGFMFYLEAIRTHKPGTFRSLRSGLSSILPGKAGSAIAPRGGGGGKRSHHHRIRTPVVGLLAGTDIVLVYGSLQRMMRAGLSSVKGTGAALSKTGSGINSGKLATTVTAAQRGHILTAALIIVVILIIAAIMHERRKHGGGRKRRGGGGGGRPAMGAGGPRAALPPGMD